MANLGCPCYNAERFRFLCNSNDLITVLLSEASAAGSAAEVQSKDREPACTSMSGEGVLTKHPKEKLPEAARGSPCRLEILRLVDRSLANGPTSLRMTMSAGSDCAKS